MNLFQQARGGERAGATGGATRALALASAALALLAWCGLLARSAQVFAPDSVYVQPFNSDSALPVLMANDPKLDLFRAYVYGQDQIGAYPFLFCRLVRRATGFVWTVERVFLLQVFWLFLSAFAVAALARHTRLVAPALYVSALCLNPLARHYVFVLNQRYAWQLTPLLFAWWTYRRLCARLCVETSGATSRALKPTLFRSLASFLFSSLAVWASPLSAPMLLCFLALEAARARVTPNNEARTHDEAERTTTHANNATPRANNAAHRADDATQRANDATTRANDATRAAALTPARLLACALPLAAAVFAERLLKAAYHRHALRHFGTDFSTPTQIDWGHLADNLRAQLSNLMAAPLWWLALPALIAAPFVCVALLRRLVNSRAHDPLNSAGDGARRTVERAPSNLLTDSSFLLAGARLDTIVLMLGALAVAVINFASAFLFLWIRLNSYGGRYLALTHLFGAFAGLLALFLLATLHPRIHAARRTLFPAVAAACALVLALKFPPVAKNPEYENLREVAAGLAERDPRVVLLGGYWDTYVFAALRPGDSITPVPAEDQLLRTPWAAQTLRDAARVVVVQHPFTYSGEIESPRPYDTFGDGREPPPVIRQYGATLRLETPRWYERGGYVFTLYRNETHDAQTTR